MLKKLLKPFIFLLMGLLFINIVWTVGFLETAPLYWFSNPSDILAVAEANATAITETNATAIDQWAIRGQIGDIMSGHFSALAFLAVALSIIYQSEANVQMRESIDKQEDAIEQQNKALEIQSKALQSQIRELEESRQESSKQTEEFAINNMNIKLDRYYKFLNEKLIKLIDTEIYEYERNKAWVKKYATHQAVGAYNKKIKNKELFFDSIYDILEFIYLDIESMKDKPNTYAIFHVEFRIRIESNYNLMDVFSLYPINENYTMKSFVDELKK